jgi:assimilatory nitrate reductase catalytic subunit
LQLVPGTDLAVANGLLNLAVVDGLIDEGYVSERCLGFDAVRRSVLAWTPDRVERISGVPEASLRAVVRALAEPPASMLLSGRGPEQQSKGVDTVLAFTNLMLALGKVGRPAAGYGCLTGQGNGQGGREHGQKADQLPGYRSIADPADRELVAGRWGIPAGALPGPGLSADEMLGSLGPGGLRALLVAGSNVAVASAHSRRVVDGLRRLDCLAVLDSFDNDTTRDADFVLPVTQWAEEDGTTTSLEGRVLRRRRAVEAPPGVRSDLEVLCALANRLGASEHFGSSDPEAVFTELAELSAGGRADYSGISYERLDDEGGVYWPCPTPGIPEPPASSRSASPIPMGEPDSSPCATGRRPSPGPPSSERPPSDPCHGCGARELLLASTKLTNCARVRAATSPWPCILKENRELLPA